ncbi:hypothetical protein LHYA1_G008991 [Lachnellula hyalina]|uniref:Uncharacterized protein n=1 Tax=Lachnellula hyalina TaxID=1316788 RepID=A0A8H8QT27_9HELO|nr:uncharacterized protein LHYA1_G008991 [Lachnellula hyalina]TVY22288.1 hypothetical protein LHYA1_G008991 [Lachnellula hyalina]
MKGIYESMQLDPSFSLPCLCPSFKPGQRNPLNRHASSGQDQFKLRCGRRLEALTLQISIAAKLSQHPPTTERQSAQTSFSHTKLPQDGETRTSSAFVITLETCTLAFLMADIIGCSFLFLRTFLLYDAKYGFSEKITQAQNGYYVWPFGIIKPCARADVYKAIDEGRAKQFWEWCEEKAKPFM